VEISTLTGVLLYRRLCIRYNPLELRAEWVGTRCSCVRFMPAQAVYCEASASAIQECPDALEILG